MRAPWGGVKASTSQSPSHSRTSSLGCWLGHDLERSIKQSPPTCPPTVDMKGNRSLKLGQNESGRAREREGGKPDQEHEGCYDYISFHCPLSDGTRCPLCEHPTSPPTTIKMKRERWWNLRDGKT